MIKPITILGIVFSLAFLLIMTACRDRGTLPAYDAGRTFQLLQSQTDLGPRNPGSEGWRRFQTLLAAHFDSLQVKYEKQAFDYHDYMTGDTVPLVNWIARLNPTASKRILVAAHYDSRPRAENDPDPARRQEPIIGANDGASGVAVLMHLAEILIAHPPRIGVDLIFFDGEDYGPPGRNDQYLIGSTYFAGHQPYHYEFGILLDMIGDRDLKIYRETLSERYAKAVNDKVWNAAARLGVPQFVDSVKYDVLDDHIPLIAAGIPTIDIIDFEYPYWHTQADTPDKCDTASLSAVGRVVLDVIYGE